MGESESAIVIATALQRLAKSIESNAASVADIRGKVQHVDADGTTVFSFQIVAKQSATEVAASRKPRTLTLEEKIFDEFNKAIHPSPIAFARCFKALGLILVVPAFAAILAISSPFARPEQWACSVESWLATSGYGKETLAHACDWTAMAAQVAIILFIGGIAFTDSFARRVARMATRFQQATIHSQLQTTAAERKKLEEAYNRLLGIPKIKGRFRQAKHALEVFRDLYADVNWLPNRYIWFGVRGLAFNFPGGLYGILGLFFLLVQILAISTKIALDYVLCWR